MCLLSFFILLLYSPANATSLSQLSCLPKMKTPFFLAELYIVHLSFQGIHVLIIYTKFGHISIPGSWKKNSQIFVIQLWKKGRSHFFANIPPLSDMELPQRSLKFFNSFSLSARTTVSPHHASRSESAIV